MTLTRSIYYFDKLTPFDKWTVGLYVMLSLGLSYYFFTEPYAYKKAEVILYYGIGTHLILYTFLYKSLRNLTVFSIWLLFGLLHLLVYFKLKDDTALQTFRGHSTTPLRNTTPLLGLYLVLRIVSLKTRRLELVVPNKTSRTDMFDERQPTGVDFVYLFIFWIVSILLDLTG